MKRQRHSYCFAPEAAKRLRISVDEVERLISTAELSAVTFMDDPRWYIDLESVKDLARSRAKGDQRRSGFWNRVLVFR